MDGILSLIKPVGPSSHHMVRMVKKLTGSPRVGHGGTLDPKASGILPILIGQATRMSDFFLDAGKTYLAEIRLGISTNTYDSEGTVTEERDVADITLDRIRAALPQFTGQILQRPPMYSAVKQGGQPLYKSARAGREVERVERTVDVKSINIVEWSSPFLRLEIACGRGTYIRSIAHELGQALGCGGYLTGLERTQVGMLTLKNSITPYQLFDAAHGGHLGHEIMTLDTVAAHLPAAICSEDQMLALLQGQYIPVSEMLATETTLCRAYDLDGEMFALLAKVDSGSMWRPSRVLTAVHPSAKDELSDE